MKRSNRADRSAEEIHVATNTIDVRKLYELPQPVLTVYLNANPSESQNRRRVPAYLIWLRNEAKSLASHVPPADKKTFAEQLDRVEAFLMKNKAGNPSVLLLAGLRVWEEIPLSVPVRNELRWGKPALVQLTEIFGEQKPSCIVVVDRTGARFYRYHAGRFTEYPKQTFRIDISQWKDKEHAHMAQRGAPLPHGFQRDAFNARIDDEYRHICRHIADTTKDLCAKDHLYSIFLVGSDRLIEPIESELPRELRAHVVLIDQDLAGFAPSELHAYLAPRIAERGAKMMNDRVQELLSRDSGTVIGLDETLELLQTGTIGTMIVARGLEAALRKCLTCGLTNGSADPVCPACGGKRMKVTLSEVLYELASLHQTAIEIVTGEAAAKLSEVGGIGGWLRQRQQPHEIASVRKASGARA